MMKVDTMKYITANVNIPTKNTRIPHYRGGFITQTPQGRLPPSGKNEALALLSPDINGAGGNRIADCQCQPPVDQVHFAKSP
jgi:hypothetical protein